MMAEPSVYLDNLATTAVDPRVMTAMLPWFTETFGNASSVSHAAGRVAAEAVASARRQIADAIRAEPDEIVFTSGATEANNLAIKGTMRASRTRRHLIVSAVEHKAVLDPARRLAREGFELTIVGADAFGGVQPEAVEAALRDDTALVSIMQVNNEVGTINPIREIADVCRQRDVLLHCDAAQALGKTPVDVAELGIDLLSLSAHKAYGPKGVGVLYVRAGDRRPRPEPLVHGGGHELGLRSGTIPVPLVVGFGHACELAVSELATDSFRISGLRSDLLQRLQVGAPDLVLNGHAEKCVSGSLNLSLPGLDGDLLFTRLSGVDVSSGSACSTSDPEPSHVLRAMGRSSDLARASLRIGIGRFTTTADIEAAAERIVAAIVSCRGPES